MKLFHRHPLLVLLMLALLLSLIIFLVFPPFYGLMDDANFQHLLPALHEKGLLGFVRDWLPKDIVIRGGIRPFLPLMIYVFYLPTEGHVQALHLWNALFVVSTLAFLAFALQRFWQAVFIQQNWAAPTLRSLFFLLLLAFPWTHLGVALPAVQEKMIFFAGALALWTFSSDSLAQKPHRHIFYLLVLIAGSFVREQFILFYPLLLAILWIRERERKLPWETLAYLAITFSILVFIWWLGRHSDYKSKYGIETIFVTLKNSRSIWGFVLLAFVAMMVPLLSRETWRIKIAQLAPGISLLGFVILMAPWGLGGYLNIVAAPFFAAALVALFPERVYKRLPSALQISAGALCFAVFCFGLLLDASVKQDLGRLLASDELKAANQQGVIYTPCDEGSGAMRSHSESFFGYSLHTKVPPTLEELKKNLAPGQKTYWIVGKHLNCWPGDFDPQALVDAAHAHVVWRGHSKWSPRLLLID